MGNQNSPPSVYFAQRISWLLRGEKRAVDSDEMPTGQSATLACRPNFARALRTMAALLYFGNWGQVAMASPRIIVDGNTDP